MDARSAASMLPPGLEDARLIAHGGFASVYRAWQPDFHREVAVKVLAADAGDVAVRSRFDREVRAMGALSDHPNVVPVYDAGVAGDRPYLVMPFLAGGSLADDPRPRPADEVVRIGVAVADALEAAHRAGLLHRDVKPANILRTARGEPKLADFGVARFADATATHGQLALTLAYAAPEVLRGEPATVASDVYSLGATLHALLRGDPPFTAPDGASPMAVAMQIVEDEPPDLRATGVPGGLAAVIERAMAKDPAARFASAADLRAALASSAGDVTTVVAATQVLDAPPVRPTVPAPTPVAPAKATSPAPATERRPSSPWLPLLVGLAVVVAIVAVALTALGDDEDPGGEGAPATSTTAASNTTVPDDTTTVPAPTTTTTTTTAAPAPGADPVDAARDYFALLDAGDVEAGWQRLSPRYQNESGREEYEGFWETIDSVEVLSAEPGSDPLTALVELRYVRTDGSETVETNTLRFVEREGGRLFIDGSS